MMNVSSKSARPVTEDELQAYVDGFLPAPRRAAIEAYLAINPDEAERIEAYRAQRIGMHALFDRAADRLLPADLVALERQVLRALDRRRRQRTGLRVAASVAALITAGAAGWWASEIHASRNDPLVVFARNLPGMAFFAAPPTVGAATPGDQESRLVGWLTRNAVAASMPMPNLQPLGFSFLGGRILPTPAGPAVQLTYEDAKAQRVNLYISTIAGVRKADFTFLQERGVSLFYWSDGSLVYALIGNRDRNGLLEIAKAIGDGFAPSTASAAASALKAASDPGIYRADPNPAGAANSQGAKVLDTPPAATSAPPHAPLPPAALQKPDSKTGADPVVKKPDETRT